MWRSAAFGVPSGNDSLLRRGVQGAGGGGIVIVFRVSRCVTEIVIALKSLGRQCPQFGICGGRPDIEWQLEGGGVM